MLPNHKEATARYELIRKDARQIAETSLPSHLKGKLKLDRVGLKEITTFRTWQDMPERKVDWDWNFASRYCFRYPKAFDLSVWFGGFLCSLTLGRPTYRGTEIRLDFIEKSPKNCIFSGDMFRVSLLAYETYGDLIGASKIRVMEPTNKKLIDHYMSYGGFSHVPARQGNPHYLVRAL